MVVVVVVERVGVGVMGGGEWLSCRAAGLQKSQQPENEHFAFNRIQSLPVWCLTLLRRRERRERWGRGCGVVVVVQTDTTSFLIATVKLIYGPMVPGMQ